jgi:hypothetical protein
MRMKLRWIVCASMVLAATTHAQAASDCALMQRLAQQHSNDMARRDAMDHSGFSERAAQGARAENVAAGNKTKAATMAQWRASAGHAANMRLPGCKAVAYAVSRSGQYYWTMEIGKSPAELAARGRMQGPQATRARRGARVITFPLLTW